MSRDTQSYIDLLECDTARFVKGLSGKIFLIIGHKKNTKDSLGQWYKNDEPIDFDYIEEKVVASGDTYDELVVSAKEFKKISKMSWQEYFSHLGTPIPINF